MRNCLDAHLGQIVCDKDGFVERPMTRFEESISYNNTHYATNAPQTIIGWVDFYGISTIVGYLIPNSLYT